MKGTTIFFLSILLITTGCKRLDQTADDLITVDVTNNSFPKKELALQDFMDVEYIPLETRQKETNATTAYASIQKLKILPLKKSGNITNRFFTHCLGRHSIIIDFRCIATDIEI